MDDVIISIRGEKFQIVYGTLSQDLLSRMKYASDFLGLPVESTIFTEDFYVLLDVPGLKSWKAFGNISTLEGIVVTESSSLEIQIKGKKRFKYKLSKLTDPMLLFPLISFKTTSFEAPQTGVNSILEEREVGLVGKYKFRVKSFEVDKIELEYVNALINGVNLILIVGLTYDRLRVKAAEGDSLVTYSSVIIR